MSKTLDSLAANIVLDVDLRNGEIRDRSSTAAVVTPTGTPIWRKGRFGRNIGFSGVTNLSVADAVAQRITTGTLLVFRDTASPILPSANGEQFICKWSGGCCYAFYMSSTFTLVLYDGTNAAQSSAPVSNNAAMYAATLVSGQKPRFYINGSFLQLGSLTNTFPTTAGIPVTLGNYPASLYACSSGLARCVVLNVVLTDAQIAAIYEELTNERGNLVPELRNLVYPYPKVPATETLPAIEYDMETKNGAKLANLGSGGSVWDQTMFGGSFLDKGAFDKARHYVAGGYAYIGACSVFNGATKITAEGVFTRDAAGVGSNEAWGWAVDASNRFTFMINGGVNIYIYCANGASGYGLCNIGTIVGIQYHYRIEYDGTAVGDANRLKFYLDGVQQVLTFGGAAIPASLPAVSYTFYVGTGEIGQFYGTQSYLRIWSNTGSYSIPTAAENARHYQQFQRLMRYRMDMSAVPVTLANVTAGQIPGTTYEVISGTWNVVQDAATPYRKHFYTTATGSLLFQQKYAYGNWLFRMQHNAGANSNLVMLVGNQRKDYTDAAQNGYLFYLNGTSNTLVLVRITGGAVVATVFASAGGYTVDGVEYQYAITRSKVGVWNGYIKGGAYTTWTLIGTGTDTTYTVSNYGSLKDSGVTIQTFTGMTIFEEPLDPTIAADGAFIDSLG